MCHRSLWIATPCLFLSYPSESFVRLRGVAVIARPVPCRQTHFCDTRSTHKDISSSVTISAFFWVCAKGGVATSIFSTSCAAGALVYRRWVPSEPNASGEARDTTAGACWGEENGVGDPAIPTGSPKAGHRLRGTWPCRGTAAEAHGSRRSRETFPETREEACFRLRGPRPSTEHGHHRKSLCINADWKPVLQLVEQVPVFEDGSRASSCQLPFWTPSSFPTAITCFQKKKNTKLNPKQSCCRSAVFLGSTTERVTSAYLVRHARAPGLATTHASEEPQATPTGSGGTGGGASLAGKRGGDRTLLGDDG